MFLTGSVFDAKTKRKTTETCRCRCQCSLGEPVLRLHENLWRNDLQILRSHRMPWDVWWGRKAALSIDPYLSMTVVVMTWLYGGRCVQLYYIPSNVGILSQHYVHWWMHSTVSQCRVLMSVVNEIYICLKT